MTLTQDVFERAPMSYEALSARIEDRTATVGVVGLGYVGLPLLSAAGDEGFGLIGVDRSGERIRQLKENRPRAAQFTTDSRVLLAADVILVAVPTPLSDGSPDLSLVCDAMRDVAAVLRPGQLVVLESTTYPGTTEEIVRPILEASGLVAGVDFALAYSPERINPGSDWTFRETPKVVAGITEADTALAAQFYGMLVERVVTVSSPRQAEAAKLIENIFRQVNIAVVNELATVAPAIGVDVWEALDAAASKPFGYMPFWPGPGVGGHCIAIDPTYLSWRVEQRLGFGVGFIEHARSVNNRMPAYVASRVAEALNSVGKAVRGARLLVLGVTYKPGVDDVRESPALSVLQRLVAAGADCVYHDPYVPSVALAGRRSADAVAVASGTSTADLPWSESVPVTDELVESVDCVVILTPHPELDYRAIVDLASLVFDAVGVTRGRRADHVVLL